MSEVVRKVVDGRVVYHFHDNLSLKSALHIMDISNSSVRFYVKTKVTKHEFHTVSETRHNIHPVTVSVAEKLETIIRLIDRYRSQRKMAINDRNAELRYHQAIAVRAEQKRRGEL